MSYTILSKRKEYTDYINEHISNVKKAFDEFINNNECLAIVDEITIGSCIIIDIVYANIKHHDESKFSEEEFEPYRKHFYPINDKEKEDAKEEFDKAWKHHYLNNPHHWDGWALNGNEMPIIYIIEMLCDWQAMSYKFDSNTLDWYNKEKKEIKLLPKTKVTVERLLDAYCK